MCEQEFSVAPLYSNIGAILRATAELTQPVRQVPVHLIVALDASVSMRSSFQHAKSAVSYFYCSALSAGRTFASNTLYVFAGETYKRSLDGLDVNEVQSAVYSAQTLCGTNFNSVLSAIRLQVQEQGTGGAYFVVFFTDGQVLTALRAAEI